MFPAVITTFLFALSAVSAGRTTRLLGGTPANFCRLVLATLFLTCWAYSRGQGITGRSFGWFFLSGVIGFGLGDLALYGAFSRIGARLGVLMCLCLSAPLGALMEWVWLGTRLSLPEILWGMIILAGVAVALVPDQRSPALAGSWVIGTLFGLIAAFGQGGGAVLTRKAYAVARQAGLYIDGGTAAFQRILGGLLLTIVVILVCQAAGRRPFSGPVGTGSVPSAGTARQRWRKAWPWVIVNSLCGPALGVACFQWALSETPTGIVLAIVATTPLAVIPFVLILEGERPSLRSLIGGVIAVAGAVALALH
ncbi:MAG: DMT family transporter [Sedimentisphaerales bacterium]|nr:DMT family transporter [Sedimentisphaerales bacterium]